MYKCEIRALRSTYSLEMLSLLCLSRKRSVLELAIHQSGNAASKAAAEDASGSDKEGSSAGILKVPL